MAQLTQQTGAIELAAADEPVLCVSKLSKSFPGTVALDAVSLDIAPGEIHALVGQNGSGKSTLIKVLAGYHKADDGSRAWLNGEPFDVTNAAGDRHHRLRFVHQDLGLFPELSAVENLALRGEFVTGIFGRVDWRKQRTLTSDLVEEFDLDLDLDAPLSQATPVQRTVVAIAAALAGWQGGSGVLVLDEPTAVLPPSDVQRLLDIVRRVRERGTSILYVSHRLDEIFRVADRVTVLRSGKVVTTTTLDGLDAQKLAELMVGSDVDASYQAHVEVDDTSPVVLRADGLTGGFMDGVNLELRAGEILGIAGLPGSGRSELPYALAGAFAETDGTVEVAGSPAVQARRAGGLDLSLVPADRAKEAVFSEMSVGENLSVSVLDRLRAGVRLRHRAERSMVGQWMNTIEVKAESPSAGISTLSGGNQQKVVLARCLAQEPKVLLLCEPTAGVDVGTRQAIYEFIARRAQAGLGVIVSSSDTGDLLAICTRVLVMCNGRVVRELSGPHINEHELIKAMEEMEQR